MDQSIAFRASRYDKSLDGTGDYLNCPMNREEYDRFYEGLVAAEAFESHIPDDVPYFESCLPIEEIARRGKDTLRFGPMKPMGLTIRAPAAIRMPVFSCVRRMRALIAGILSGFRTICAFRNRSACCG